MYALPLLAALVALAGSPDRPPSPDEQRLFDEGTRAFASGDVAAAEKAWQAGYALGHDPAFLVHIGEAQEKAGAPAQAAATYRRYLQQVPDASDRADIEQRLARLAPAPPAPTGAPPPPAESTGEFGAAPPATASVPATPPAPGAHARADAEPPPAASPSQESSGWDRDNVTAVVATALTVALLGTAGFYAAAAGSNKDNIDRLVLFHDPSTGAPLPYSSVAAQYNQAMADGHRDDHNAKVALVGAAAGAAIATVFYILDATLTHAPAVSIAPAGTGLAAVGGWAWRW
jgi:hypothetical protein